MFSRRKKRSLLRKIKELLWPGMGWRRAGHYLALRILRLSDADGHDIMARSVAWGVGMSFFPVFGIHALLAGFMAWITRGHVVVAMLGTLLVPPIILPLVFSLDFLVGRKILHAFGLSGWGPESEFEEHAASGNFDWLNDHFRELFIPAFTGFLVFMPLAWCAGYMVTHQIMSILRARYQKKHPEVHL